MMVYKMVWYGMYPINAVPRESPCILLRLFLNRELRKFNLRNLRNVRIHNVTMPTC